MNLVWSPEALQDLIEAHAYISRESPRAATEVVKRIVSLLAAQLLVTPEIGRPGRLPDTRELVIPRTPFVVPYRIGSDHIEILRVYHTSRSWPDGR